MNRTVLTSFTILCLLYMVFLSGLNSGVQPVRAASGTIYIRADGSIDPPTAPISTSDNVTYILTDNITNNAALSEDIIVIQRSNIIIDGAEHSLEGNGGGHGFSLSSVRNVTITNLTIFHLTVGIELYYSSNIIITGNEIASNTDDGIEFQDSSNCTINGNLIVYNSVKGILLVDSLYSNIADNDVSFNWEDGICLNPSSSSTICGNNITNNSDGIKLNYPSSNNGICRNRIENNSEGISLEDSSNNNITGNSIENNKDCGIYIWSAHNNTVTENNITGNKDCGISLFNDVVEPPNNRIYHNNFTGNTIQASEGSESGKPSVNFWDNGYPSGGNYWNNYSGTDSDYDGIGDTSYAYGSLILDNYPLMGMFSDFNATSEYDVQTICNSTISDFLYDGSALSFNVSGENGTTGFCRICIPTGMMNNTYQISVNGTRVPYVLLPCSKADYSYLYFTYTHSTEEVIITPEFPSFLVLPLFFIATLSAIIIHKRRKTRFLGKRGWRTRRVQRQSEGNQILSKNKGGV